MLSPCFIKKMFVFIPSRYTLRVKKNQKLNGIVQKFEKTFKKPLDNDDSYGIINFVPQETQMFERKMTIKERQEIIISEIFQSCENEWRYMAGELNEIMNFVVNHKSRQQMEDAFGSTFVKLAHLYTDAKTLLNDIEELENE